MATTLEEQLHTHTMEAAPELTQKDEKGRIRCFACAHRCLISEGKTGICKVRFHENGVLHVPAGYVAGVACDPIEKKPFFHVYPGTNALSFGMLGCDFKCSYCQNWLTSQTLRDPEAVVYPKEMTATQIVNYALQNQASVITSTYNEPLITSEWAVEIFKKARQHNIPGSYVSNGNGTPEVLDFIRPYVDFYKVDLKTFNDKNYRSLGGTLKAVLDTIEYLHEKGFWVEIVTLIIPGFNDSEEELKSIAEFLAGISKDIPWHVTGYHGDYKMIEPQSTPVSTLIQAVEIGKKAGLRFVYAGNRPGQLGQLENTNCPECNQLLIERFGFRVYQDNITEEGACPSCGEKIPGFWKKSL
jgi:pyruvate formate lyase activating enzyme